MTASIRPIAAVLACLGVWVGACTGALAQAEPPDSVTRLGVAPPTPEASWSARLLTPTPVRRAPSAHAHIVVRLRTYAPLGRGPTVLLVTGVARDATGRAWVRLLLPRRPNGAQGWAPADVMQFRRSAMRVDIDQSQRTLRVFRARHLVFRTAVAVGTSGTPTPNTHGAVAELIPTNDPGGALGPYVLPLTVHSETLFSFDGGEGRVAMHGTSQPNLLGTRASHGCIRISNAGVTRLVALVRPGVPVDIHD